MYYDVSKLPETLGKALTAIGYTRSNIEIDAGDTYCVQSPAYGDGCRGITAVVELSTGKYESHMGCWGGSNPNHSSPVDHDGAPRPLPTGFAVVSGSMGGGKPMYATVRVHPNTLAPLLPPPPGELGEDEKQCLAALRCLNSRGRKEHFERQHWASERIDAALDSLASQGLCKRSCNGATRITTEGRNACEALDLPTHVF